MDFAPYQDTEPALNRALSPSPPPRRPFSPIPRPFSGTAIRATNNAANFGNGYQKPSEAVVSSPLPNPNSFATPAAQDIPYRYGGGAQAGRLDLFETSLPLRLDHEAMLAYLLLPPAGGVLLLILEHKSDYVRFHAWQSSLVFSAVFLIHLILSWSRILSWLMFVGDLFLIAFLTSKAYHDGRSSSFFNNANTPEADTAEADALDRFEVPFIGGLASSFVDSE